MKKLIISFAGQGNGIGTLPRYEFVNFLNKHYSKNFDFKFYLDKTNKWYHSGITEETNDIPTSIKLLEKIVEPYTHVYFIGSSAGGYASILFASLLHKKIDQIFTVIAFKPQTFISEKYEFNNLKNIIKDDIKYYLFGDSKIEYNIDPLHHISHITNLNLNNINIKIEIKIIENLDLQKMKKAGYLLEIFNNILIPDT